MTDERKLPKVLVVDDSRMVRATIVKHIRGHFDVREEGDGEAAWEALLVDPAISMVLTDIGMPRLDGYGLLERIRGSRVGRVRTLPVVILSGDEDEKARGRALGLGANGFITKGSGGAELLATLHSMARLAHTQNELEESRAALARQSPMEPSTGLATEAYLQHRAKQELARARRTQSDIVALVMELDDLAPLLVRYGDHVVQLIGRKLSKMLGSRIRAEDTLTQRSASQFALLAPGTDLVAGCAFALRLKQRLENLVMTYREERIRVSVSIGVASAAADGLSSVGDLLEMATRRAQAGVAAGGNRVIASKGEVSQAALEREAAPMLSVDAALRHLRLGQPEEVAAQLPELVSTLLPLLELLESRLHCGFPIAQLKQMQNKTGSRGDDLDVAQTHI
ncbi:GGDEF domain-containing response regulator [Thauera sinica]|uniref:Response regulator n=1 Tax=Thauera sinica TaxID=2665146 RepID=A0ABW1AL72_9RHOO|nr:response regulator [Thauera sp. K11]